MSRVQIVNVRDRRSMARALRALAIGRSTVEEFESIWDRCDDYASREAGKFAWLHYDDFKTAQLVGRWKLTREQRRHWARRVLFLMTSTEPIDHEVMNRLKRQDLRIRLRWLCRFKLYPPTPYKAYWREVWPFSSWDDLAEARALSQPFS